MRVSRLRKFRTRYRYLWLTAKIAMIWYLLIFAGIYLTSSTSAVFTSKIESEGIVEAANWLEGQFNLEFKMSGNPHRTCIVDTTVKNIGPGDMTGKVLYFVYYVENGNPVKGKEIAQGEISPLKSGNSTKVSHEVNKNGRYVFIVNTNGKKFESKKFQVKDCNTNKKGKNNQQLKEDSNQVNKEMNEKDTKIQEMNKVENNTESNEALPQEDQVKEEKAKQELKEENIETEKVIEQPQEESKNKVEEIEPEVKKSIEEKMEEGEEK